MAPGHFSGGGKYGIDAATRPSGGSWSAPTTLLAMGDGVGSTASLSISPSGQAVAGFADQTGTPPTTELSLRPAGGTWQPAIELSPYDSGSQYPPSLGQDDAGDVLAAWQENIGQLQSWAEVYDANGPVMTNPSIPADGTVGVPVTFAVAPLGTWSPVTSTQWSFGDGTTALDQTVSHTYSQPGKYTVSASAGDAQGNSSTSSGTITISTAPPPAPASPGSGSVKPALSRISQSHARWRDGRAAAKAARARRPKKPPVGTRFAFALNENAQVKLSFTQLLAGRRVKRRCVAPVAANRRAHTCQRTKLRGTLTYTVSAGVHHVSFDGRIGRTRLGVGKYTVALSASDAAGRSRVNSLQFTIVR
jgi:PKD repeat protein